MAQGKLKTKVQVPGKSGRNKQKQSHQRKALGPKKGARVCKPKKARHVELSKLKRGIQKTIGMSIEAEITARANVVEPKPFHLSHPAPDLKKDRKKKKKTK
ncbi:UPF0390 protein zgc136864-like [Glandiceps talaboti]